MKLLKNTVNNLNQKNTVLVLGKVATACAMVLTSAFVLSACDNKHSRPNIEIVQNMMEQPSEKAQGYDTNAEDLRANGLPPEHTVPRGYKPYTMVTPDQAEKELTNQFVNRADLMPRGQKMFFTYCAVCHGPLGKGDGTVADKLMLAPPSLQAAKVRAWKDGYLYHMIVMGRGLMGGYGNQISREEDRWALVNFVRHLQKTQPVFPAQ